MLNIKETDKALKKLNSSILADRKYTTCLSYWSRFIRQRDGK